jgi:hypothetical protein
MAKIILTSTFLYAYPISGRLKLDDSQAREDVARRYGLFVLFCRLKTSFSTQVLFQKSKEQKG